MPDLRPIKSARLTLRQLHLEDASDIARLAGDWEVAKWTASIPHPYDEGTAREWITRVNSQPYDYIYAMDRSGLLVGSIDYNTFTGQIGYWVGRKYWRQGLATEAVVSLLGWVASLDTPCGIWTACLPDNRASIGVLQKTGFNLEGETTVNGRLRHNGAILLKFSRRRG